MTRLLFLCTGNSCRSQIAEAFGKAKLAGVDVYSAGTDPVGINPGAIATMDEIGIDIRAQSSNGLDDVPTASLDLVITLCGDAAERCPTLPGAQVEHWPIPDPAKATDDIDRVFREVRDDIAARVDQLAKRLRDA